MKPTTRRRNRKSYARLKSEAGKVKPMVLLWALGIPLPIVAIIFLAKSCTGC